MAERRIRRALIAVYDKTGIAEFARALVEEFGVEIISTGGTAKHLKEAGVPVTPVGQITGFPEMLDGRVKTLHPRIHAAILADRDNPEHMRQLAEHGIEPIDMVVVNLYPFEKTVADPNCRFEDAIEMIDIGGPCLLRAAAKNHQHVLPVSSSQAYSEVLSVLRTPRESGGPDLAGLRTRYAAGSFEATAGYDEAVSCWLGERCPTGWPFFRGLFVRDRGGLRYGENPHQSASLWQSVNGGAGLSLLSALEPGSEKNVQERLSFNNCLDADAALGLCAELTRAGGRLVQAAAPRGLKAAASSKGGALRDQQAACVVFVKHTNACGVGVHRDPLEAYRGAYLGDPNAAMGGVLAVNFNVDAAFAEAVMETFDRLARPLQDQGHPAAPGGFFVEVWLAPSFDDAAVAIIRSRKKWGANVRLLAVGDMSGEPDRRQLFYRSIVGGVLVQTPDIVGLDEDRWRVVTRRGPSESEWSDLRLAWLVAKHTRSNAISICRNGMLIGSGAGQMSRAMSCRVATWLARENGHAERLKGAAAASDAFFPFRDGPDILMEAGVTAIIQPGGSKRDGQTIRACDERDVAMIFTGTRHFRH